MTRTGYWDTVAESEATDELLTMRDPNQRQVELHLLDRLVPACSSLLDVGCGPGTVTRYLARSASRVVGMDSSPAMLERARRTGSGVEWVQADILDQQDCARLGTFDTVVSVRCLINLPSWRAQEAAIENLATLTRVGGACVLIEGWGPGRRYLNAIRQRVGLDAMPDIKHNLDLEQRVLYALAEWFEVSQIRGTGFYDMSSRVLNALLAGDSEPQYDGAVNRCAAKLEIMARDELRQAEWLGSRLIAMRLERLPTELPIAEEIDDGSRPDSNRPDGSAGVAQLGVVDQ